jgi:hypothetical protein
MLFKFSYILIGEKSAFSATQMKKSQKITKKNLRIEHFRCRARLDAEKKPSENFALQNSRQESTNPRMDLWFHVFGNAKQKK